MVTEQFADAISKRIVVAHRRGLSSSQIAYLFFFRIMIRACQPVAIANAATKHSSKTISSNSLICHNDEKTVETGFKSQSTPQNIQWVIYGTYIWLKHDNKMIISVAFRCSIF